MRQGVFLRRLPDGRCRGAERLHITAVASSRWNHFQAILEGVETLANLESLVRSAEALSFSAAAGWH